MTRQPYIGLRPFEREDSDIFFGRDLLVSDLLQRLRHSPFVAVLGLSGEGKSSLVRAGLLPALEAGYLDYEGMGWTVATMTPGVNPLEALAQALCASPWGRHYESGFATLFEQLSANPGTLRQIVRTTPTPKKTRLLIVVDQFEELFTRDDKRDANLKADTRLFVAQLLDAALRSERKIYVLLTMRSEFIGHCAEYPALAHAVTRGVFLVPRMRDTELAEAIEMPARRCKGEVEPELTHLLIEQLKGDTTLPVLQHLLMRMWKDATSETQKEKGEKEASRARSQQSRQITRDRGEERAHRGPALTRDYLAKFANPGDALDNDLDEAYRGSIRKRFTPGQQRAAEAIFRRITKQTGWSEKKKRYEYARDPATVAEIARVAKVAEEDVCAVVEAFREEGRTFLKASGGTLGPESLIDLTHEAVINNWELAQRWAANEAENARQFQQLREWAARASRDERGRYTTDSLLKGSDLEQKRRWFDSARVHSLGPQLSEQWAERYIQRDDPEARARSQERTGPGGDASSDVGLIDFKQAVEFLNASRTEAEREELRDAIKNGDIEKVAGLVERGVRLTEKLLTRSESREARGQASARWEYASHYYAAVPEPETPEEEEAPDEGASIKSDSSEEQPAAPPPVIDAQWLEAHLPPTKELPYGTLRGVRVQHYAAWGGNVEVLKYLKQQVPKFNQEDQRLLALDAKTERGLRPFDLALSNGQLDAAKWICAELRDPDLIGAGSKQHGGATALHLFVRDWALAQWRARPRPSDSEDVRNRYSAVMRWLLDEQHADVKRRDDDRLTPLHWAVEYGNADAVEMLLEKKPELDATDVLGRTPLLLAARHNNALVGRLIEQGADLTIRDGDGDTPLLASLRGSGPVYPTLQQLLRKSNDAHHVNRFTGESALHLALDRHDPWGETNAILVALIEGKARIDAVDDKGRTPMSLALDKSREDVAIYFFRYGEKDDDARCADWMTQAVRVGARDLLREMLNAGIAGDALDANGDSALHVAADQGDTGAILDLLLYSNSINIDITDAEGLTPMRRALRANTRKAAEMLYDEGAELPAYLAAPEFELAAYPAIGPALKQQFTGSASADWGHAPIMPGAWRNLSDDEAAEALYRLLEAEQDFLIQMPAERVDAVRAAPLTLLPGASLYEARLAADDRPPSFVLFLHSGSRTVWLNGAPPEILLRDMTGLDLSTQEKAREFLLLHVGANSWDRGGLRVVETPDDVPSQTPETRAIVADIVAPLQLSAGDGGKWTGEAVVQYGDELWRIGIELERNGALWIGGESAGVSGLSFTQASYKNGLRHLQSYVAPAPPNAPEPPPQPLP